MVKLEEITCINAPLKRCFDLARCVEVHLAGNVHFGESASAIGGITSGLIGMGQRVTWRAKHFGIWQHLTSEITRMDRPTFFQDTMIRGAFRSMKHDHYFRSLDSDQTDLGSKELDTKGIEQTEVRDVFYFSAPLGFLGWLAERLVLGRYMQALLHERNMVLKQIAESADWQRYLPS